MTKNKKYPSETQDRFIVRMPDGMRKKISKSAEKSGRSMNAEIVHRLQESFQSASQTGDLDSSIAEQILDRLANIEDKLAS